MNASQRYLFAGDIGATKTTLAIYEKSADLHLVVDKTYKSKSYKSFYNIVAEFMDNEVNQPITAACIGVAGPVIDGSVNTSNLDWVIHSQELKELLNVDHVLLVNDLFATAIAIPLLQKEELHTINYGTLSNNHNIAIIAPGTGLGESFLVWDGAQYIPQPSEGGNTDFAPKNQLEIELLEFLIPRYMNVSTELVCSGRGILNIYEFLKYKNYASEPESLASQIKIANDPTPIIIGKALSKDPPKICIKTVELFTSILGAEAGNLALKVWAVGGVYLCGGIPPRISSLIENSQFFDAFKRKGKFQNILEDIPIHIVKNITAPLFGAATYGNAMFFNE